MVFPEKSIQLKDGRPALLRSPRREDAAAMREFIIRASGETPFLMRYPEEYAELTLAQEEAFLMGACDDPSAAMIACLAEGKIAGSCQISFRAGVKDRHRASVAIALLKEYWSLGIGTQMLQALIDLARERDVTQIELDFVEGNARARALYEKMGFRITGVKPDAIRWKDGTFANEYMMVKRL